MISDIRTRLRAATSAPHERLHAHPGFAAAAAGVISLTDYRDLLSRLFGFHRAFELAHGVEPARARSRLIAADLETLELDADEIAALPLCPSLPAPASDAEDLGARYVLEGSTLGGVQIARALRALFADEDGRGRRFFLGAGESHGAAWREYLQRLERATREPEAAEAATRAAVLTFARFELWMSDWKPARNLGP
jgi:heme oxygenase